jgi:hypothetical protein
LPRIQAKQAKHRRNFMNHKLISAMLSTLAILLLGIAIATAQGPVGTAFTYQGSLTDGGNPANGIYEFEFKLYNTPDPDSGTQIGPTLTQTVEVTDGLFMVELDFGSDAFTGEARYLDIGVRPAGSSDPFSLLTPRQALRPVPYALHALNGSGNDDHPHNFLSASDGDPTDALVVDGEGDVGIGTTEPRTLLTVGDGTNRDLLEFNTSRPWRFTSRFSGSSTTLDLESLVPGKFFRVVAPNASRVPFEVYAREDSGSEVILVQDGGRVGIGTRSPTAKLDVRNGAGNPLFKVQEPTGSHANKASVSIFNPNNNGIGIWTNVTSSDANLVIENLGTGALIKGFGNNGGEDEFRVDNDGTVVTTRLQITGGADLSEQFDIQAHLDGSSPEPGLVVCIDAEQPGELVICSQSYDPTVAGIISGAGGVQPGMVMGQTGSEADGEFPVALTGRVYVQADASSGPIQPGDLLTTADLPGHAMKVTDHEQAHGAILGKAMSTLDEGQGLVLVLVSLQ